MASQIEMRALRTWLVTAAFYFSDSTCIAGARSLASRVSGGGVVIAAHLGFVGRLHVRQSLMVELISGVDKL